MKQGTKDLLSIIVPALQLLLLGVLTALFTSNIDKFRAGIDESQMINQLVKDLSKDSTNSNLRADFVMLSLERYLKRSHKGNMADYDKVMLVGFAKSIIINRFESSNIRDNNKTNDIEVPKEILTRYDPTRVNDFIANQGVKITPRSAKSDNDIVKSLDTEEPAGQLANTKKSKLFNVLIPKLVYIQYNNAEKRTAVDSIRIPFQAKKWYAPGVEYRKGNYTNSIRYFYPEDISLVEDAFKILDSIHYQDFKKILMPKNEKVSKGQIEIWINNK